MDTGNSSCFRWSTSRSDMTQDHFAMFDDDARHPRLPRDIGGRASAARRCSCPRRYRRRKCRTASQLRYLRRRRAHRSTMVTSIPTARPRCWSSSLPASRCPYANAGISLAIAAFFVVPMFNFSSHRHSTWRLLLTFPFSAEHQSGSPTIHRADSARQIDRRELMICTSLAAANIANLEIYRYAQDKG